MILVITMAYELFAVFHVSLQCDLFLWGARRDHTN